MKVLLITPFFFERHRWMISAYKTALELSKDHEVAVLTTGRPAYEELSNTLRIYRMRDMFFPDPLNQSIIPGLWWSIWRVMRKEKPEMFLVSKHMFFTALAVPFLRMLGKRVIIMTDTFPGINWFPRTNMLGRFALKAYSALYGVPMLKMASKVVLLHEGLIGIAEKLGLKFEVIHNGVETERFDLAKPSPDIPRSPERINIGYVGRLESIKGYDDVIAVAKEMTQTDARLHFYFIGNTGGKEEYVRETESHQIHFLGHRDDLPALYPQLDMFILASYSEGLPNALMEAMYSRVACISSAVGGVLTLIRPGENGLLFEAGDRDGMQEQIKVFVANPQLRAALGEEARRTIEHGYTWVGIRQQFTRLFTSL